MLATALLPPVCAQIMPGMPSQTMPPPGKGAAKNQAMPMNNGANMKPGGMTGMKPGELPGSLMDALMKVVPDMKMTPDMIAPGVTPTMMTSMMVKDWQDKYASIPDIAPLPMNDGGPMAVPPLPAEAVVTDAQAEQAKKAAMSEAEASDAAAEKEGAAEKETAAQKTAAR